MSSISIAGDTSGSVIIAAPAVAGSTTLTLPTTTGTLVTSNAMPTGSVLQVVSNSYSTQVSSTSTSDTDSGLFVNITPTSSSNKVLILVSQNCYISSDNGIGLNLYRNGSQIYNLGSYVLFTQTGGVVIGHHPLQYLDSPATTSELTYRTYFRSRDSGETVGVNRDSSNTSVIIAMEIKA
jgi:hypothetical protein